MTEHSATVTWKPFATAQLLRGCRSCGDRHPLAYDPPSSSTVCLKCGIPVQEPGPVIDIPVELTDAPQLGDVD